MSTVTLFEHQIKSYSDLGWDLGHPALAQLEQLNVASGVELIHLGYRWLKATQYVGVIRVGEITIQILPKIDWRGDTEASEKSVPRERAVSSATSNLLYLLSYAQGLRVREQDVASLQARRSDWFELLTGLFARNLHRLMKRGPERSYSTVEETLGVMRGRWRITDQLRRAPHLRHKFDVVYDEFSPDTPLNRVFQFVTAKLLLVAEDRENRRLLSDLRDWLSCVRRHANVSQADLDQVHFTRLNDRFLPTFNLARLFIENSVFQLMVGQRRTFAFVFDMNRLFEEFVAGFIEVHKDRILSGEWSDARVVPQSRGMRIHLAEILPGGRRVFRLVPDVMINRPSGKPLLVLDTKYKQLSKTGEHLSISEGDMYQMLAYAVSVGCPRVLLLYPQPAGSRPVSGAYQVINSPNFVMVRTVNLQQRLDRPDSLIQEMRKTMKEVTGYDPSR